MSPMAPSLAARRGAAWSDRREVAPERPSGEELARLIRRGIGLGRFELPALPHVAARVLQLTAHDDVSLREVAAVIEQDVVLSARVIRLVQSPIYSRGVKIASIGQAVTRLGLATLRDLVAEAGLHAAVFSSQAYAPSMEALRLHCSATAQMTALVSQASKVEQEHVFLAGLFHDIGIAAALLLIAEAYPAGPPPLDDVWQDVLWLHEKVNWHVARVWELPERIKEVIRHHHRIPEGAADPVGSSIVCLAEWLAVEAGAGHAPAELEARSPVEAEGVTGEAEVERACEWLGFSSETLEDLTDRAREIVSQLE